VVFVPLADDPDYDLAFTVATGNRWGLAVSKSRPSLRGALDEALARSRPADSWRRPGRNGCRPLNIPSQME
jgi:polar amino acid transport system substrate-binding protein